VLVSQKMQNHTKMCLLGLENEKLNSNPIWPSNPKNVAASRQFPVIVLKHESPSMSECTKTIRLTQYEQSESHTNTDHMTKIANFKNATWQTTAILKI